MKQIFIIIIDLLVIYGCFFGCFFLLGENHLDHFEKNLNAFYMVAPLIAILYLIFMYEFNLYNSARKSLIDVVYSVFLVSFFLTIGIMAACFFIREGAWAFPRSVIFISATTYWLVLTCWRLMIWKYAKKSHGVKNVTVIGPEADEIAKILRKKYLDLYKVDYICSENADNLLTIVKKSKTIFLTSGISNVIRKKILLSISKKKDVDVYFVPEYHDLFIMSASFQKTDDVPTFYLPTLGLTLEDKFVKRLLDLILSSVGLVLAFPIGLIISVLIKRDGGPVFYAQERLTYNGKIFKILKFRTMIPDAEKVSGPIFAGDNDPRITKIGHFIRATRIDELPQIINILRGDMSIVGPRPERPFFAEQFEMDIPQYGQRLKVKAGLTGMAQVEGKYNTSVENKLRYDLLYINNYSLVQDFLIILQTIKILFMKESTEGLSHSDVSRDNAVGQNNWELKKVE